MNVTITDSRMTLYRWGFCLFLFLFVAVSAGTATSDSSVPSLDRDQLLQDRAFNFMQQVNMARRDPLSAAVQLGVAEELVRSVFADAPWMLDQGLPPLAWNELLVSSASVHGRDMFTRLFYSYVNPDGVTVEYRVAAAGYSALFVGESMNALFFGNNYVAPDDAFNLLVAALLRDELSGAVARNIFSPDMTEIGVSFFAETVSQLADHPYVYLLLADVAAPMDGQRYAIIRHDPAGRVVFHHSDDDHWTFPHLVRPGLTQMHLSGGVGEFVVIDASSQSEVFGVYAMDDRGAIDNRYFELSALGHQ